MTRISELTEDIMEELEGAKEYAESYLWYKSKGSNRSAQYKSMAQEELTHATILHNFVVEDIEELRKSYTPPQDMQDKWDKSHKCYVEKTAWIKQMLAM